MLHFPKPEQEMSKAKGRVCLVGQNINIFRIPLVRFCLACLTGPFVTFNNICLVRFPKWAKYFSLCSLTEETLVKGKRKISMVDLEMNDNEQEERIFQNPNYSTRNSDDKHREADAASASTNQEEANSPSIQERDWAG